MKTHILAAIVAALALPAMAQTAAPRADQPGARIQAAETKAKADGTVTAKERAKLARKQNKQGRKTDRQKHDRKVAPKA